MLENIGLTLRFAKYVIHVSVSSKYNASEGMCALKSVSVVWRNKLVYGFLLHISVMVPHLCCIIIENSLSLQILQYDMAFLSAYNMILV